MKRVHSIIFLLLSICSVSVFAVQVDVGGVNIKIPEPSGFVDITDVPEIYSTWKKEYDGIDSLLAGFMAYSDYSDWKKTRDFDFGYTNARVSVVKALKSLDVSLASFDNLKSKTKKIVDQYPKALVPSKENNKYFTINPELKPGEAALASFKEEPGSFTVISLVKLNDTQYRTISNVTFLIKQRVLSSFIEADGSEIEIAWLKKRTAEWLTNIKNANK